MNVIFSSHHTVIVFLDPKKSALPLEFRCYLVWKLRYSFSISTSCKLMIHLCYIAQYPNWSYFVSDLRNSRAIASEIYFDICKQRYRYLYFMPIGTSRVHPFLHVHPNVGLRSCKSHQKREMEWLGIHILRIWKHSKVIWKIWRAGADPPWPPLFAFRG